MTDPLEPDNWRSKIRVLAIEPNSWRSKIMALVKKHDLGFLHNPGGGQFTNVGKGINIQVPLCDYKQDYFVLLKGLCDLGIDPLEPPDSSHPSDEECLTLCPQGFHTTGDFEPDNSSLDNAPMATPYFCAFLAGLDKYDMEQEARERIQSALATPPRELLSHADFKCQCFIEDYK